MTIFSGPAQAYAVGRSFFANVTTSVTRPADTTAYAANDAISDSTSAPTVLTLAGGAQESKHGGIIRGCTLVKSTSTTTLASFSVLRSEEHTSELQSQSNLVCRLLLEK